VPGAAVLEFTASDGYTWKCRRYDPAGPSRGEIVALHGIQSHGGWYENSCSWLAGRGWGVSFLDRRGSGLNDAARGDCPGFRRLVDDVAEYLRSRPSQLRPVVLLAISWGAKLATALQMRHPGLCDRLVLITPGFCPRVRPSLRERLRIAARRFVRPSALHPIPLNEPELFTANPERVRYIADDPLALRRATARLLFESARMDLYLKVARRYVTVPTLVLLAGRDRIIDNERTRRFVRRFADVSLAEFRDANHTLEFEGGGPPFLDCLERWLYERIPPAPGKSVTFRSVSP
jgi:alpha-beta hydrolase superfamily lysophospholipase